MKRILIPIVILLLLAGEQALFAQVCDKNTPVYTVDLSGNPNGTWISPSDSRKGQCCSAVKPDVCVQFIITLDTGARGISFNIASGAVPPGALYYQVNCGKPVMVGEPICLNTPGPHLLTFCKPGNNPNSYSITSTGEPHIITRVDHAASPKCPAMLTATGADKSGLTWTSVPPNSLYNSFLNCTTGCDTVQVVPSGNYPPYIDYMACASAGACITGTFCDTIRVYFKPELKVSVSPNNALLCNGGANTQVIAMATGGSGAYQYLWSNGQTTSTINVGPGTYKVTVRDTAICAPATATAVITVLPPIVANAGNDVSVCSNNPAIKLNGTIQTATGAVWTGGTGTFNPNNATLNATYTPSPSEIARGYVNLVLTTTANQGCAAASDTLHIVIALAPVVTVTGDPVICSNSAGGYTTNLVAGCSYSWSVMGGTINGPSYSNSVNITWGSGNAGIATVTVMNSAGCVAKASQTVSLVVQPNPVIKGNSSTCMYTPGVFSVSPTYGSTYSWTATNGTISGSATNSSIQVIWNASGNGKVAIKETNSYGCSSSYEVPVTVLTQPIASISGSSTGCVGNSASTYSCPLLNGATYTWSVAGGTIVSADEFNRTITVNWNRGGRNMITLSVSIGSGCDSSVVFPVNVGTLNTPSVDANNYEGCPPLSVTISGNTPGDGQTYAWTFGDERYSSAANPTHVYEKPGTYNLFVLTKHPSGCKDSASATVRVYDVPRASFSHNYEGETYLVGEGNLQLTNTTVGGRSYLWSLGTGDTSNAFEPHVTFKETGDYTITLTAFSADGCPHTTAKEIHVRNREHIYVPNAFTPNGDNTNDNFIMLYSHIASATVTIYNRWGQVVFTSDNKDFQWNGYFHGKPAEIAVYVYKIDAIGESGKSYNLKGTVTLYR